MIILHATLANPANPDEFRSDAALQIREGRIQRIGGSPELCDTTDAEGVIDAHGGLVLPGLVCGHTHFYGAFARGMSLPGEPASNFPEILDRLWWRLDKALQPEDVKYSALAFMCDAIRHGTTTVMDHHASPNAVDGCLDAIADACTQAGVRACLSYELSDRDGPARFEAGLAENERFARRVWRTDPNERGMLAASMGLHASFTLSERSLEAAAGTARDLGIGCHLHIAEDRSDAHDSLEQYGVSVVERLDRAGVLGSRTIAAHCIHLDDEDLRLLARNGTWVVHNARSNMNNAVGTARVREMLAAGIPVALGNDGFSMDMFQEFKAAYLLHKQASADPRAMPANELATMQWGNSAALAGAMLARPGLGELSAGAPADLVILDYATPTPITSGNLPWHIAFGIDGNDVATTIVAGKVLMRDRQLLTIDEEQIMCRARQLATQLWARA